MDRIDHSNDRKQSNILYATSVLCIIGVMALLMRCENMRRGNIIGEPDLPGRISRCVENMESMVSAIEAFRKDHPQQRYPVQFKDVMQTYYAVYKEESAPSDTVLDASDRLKSWAKILGPETVSEYLSRLPAYRRLTDTEYVLTCNATDKCDIRYSSATGLYQQLGMCHYQGMDTIPLKSTRDRMAEFFWGRMHPQGSRRNDSNNDKN